MKENLKEKIDRVQTKKELAQELVDVLEKYSHLYINRENLDNADALEDISEAIYVTIAIFLKCYDLTDLMKEGWIADFEKYMIQTGQLKSKNS